MTSLGQCILQNKFIESEKISLDEKKLVLAYEDLSEIPQHIIDKYSRYIETLDLSYNHIR